MKSLTQAELVELLRNPQHQVMFDDITGSGLNGILDLCITVPTEAGDVDYMVSIRVDLTTAVSSKAQV